MAVTAIKKDTAKSKEAEAPPAKAPGKKKTKLILLVAGVLVLAGIGGGAYWYFMHDGAKGEAKVQPAKPPLFVPLETFTVNLRLEEAPQFLQVGLSLKVADNAAADALKLHMPEIRDSILLLLSSKKASELLTVDGKRKLSNDIVSSVNGILAPRAPAVPAAKPKPAAPPAEAAAEAPAAEEASDAAASDAPAAEKAPAKAAPVAKAELPVSSVLFTAFIIQ